MTPIEHYRKAEALLKQVDDSDGHSRHTVEALLARAQVHATLATAVGRGRYIVDGAGHVEPLSGVGPV